MSRASGITCALRLKYDHLLSRFATPGERLPGQRPSANILPVEATSQEASIRGAATIISVTDGAGHFAWDLMLLGPPRSVPAHKYFGQILSIPSAA